MSGWVDGWVGGCVNDWVCKEWVSGWVKSEWGVSGWVGVWMIEWVKSEWRVSVWVRSEWVGEWVGLWLSKCVSERASKYYWVSEWINEWVGGCVSNWASVWVSPNIICTKMAIMTLEIGSRSPIFELNLALHVLHLCCKDGVYISFCFQVVVQTSFDKDGHHDFGSWVKVTHLWI